MPQNKRESLIYTVLMCFCMVLWMSMYNVTLHMGGFSMEVLRERLVGRGTETAEVIHQRLARAAQEAEGVDEYDYVLVNDQLDEAVDRLHGIIQSEHFSMKRNLDFITKYVPEIDTL